MAKKGKFKPFLWGVAAAAVAFPVVPLFNHLGRPEFERPVYYVILIMLVAVKVCWELRDRPWFWITIGVIVALHVPLVMLIAQRLSRTSFPVMLFLCFVDFAAILAVIGLIEKLNGKTATLS